MAADLGRSVLELATDSSKFFSDLDKVDARVGALKKTFSDNAREIAAQDKAYGSLRDRLSGVAKSSDDLKSSTSGLSGQLRDLLPAATVASVGLLVKQFTDAAGAVNDMSERLGVSTTTVQRWKFAADQTGSSIEGIATSVSHLQKNVDEGGRQVTEDFDRIGLSIDTIRRMQPDEMFETVAEAVKHIEDPTERTRIAMDLFGKSGTQILPMITEGVKELGDQAEATGNVMSEKLVKQGDALGDSWSALLGSGKQLVGGVLSPMAPLLTSVATGASMAFGWVGKLGSSLGEVVEKGVAVRQEEIDFALEQIGLKAEEATPKVEALAAAGDRLIASMGTKVSIPDDALGHEDEIIAQLDAVRKKNEETWRAAEEAEKKAAAAADALNDSQRKTIDTMKQAGIVTAETVAIGLAPLIEKLNLAAKADEENGGKTHNLQMELAAVTPEFLKLRDAIHAAGGETAALDAILDAFNQRAGITQQALIDLELAIPIKPLTDVVGTMQRYDIAAEKNKVSTDLLTGAFESFGLKTPAQLQKVAHDAEVNYRLIVQSGQGTKADIKKAWQEMTDAQLAAQGRVRSDWDRFIVPGIKQAGRDIETSFSGNLASMLTHEESWKDGALNIFRDFKKGIADILSEILQDFEGRFLKGLLGMLTGRKGAMSSAFAGMFSPTGGGGGTNLLGLFGGGSTVDPLTGAASPGGLLGKLLGLGGTGGVPMLSTAAGLGTDVTGAAIAADPALAGLAPTAGISAGLSGLLGGVGAAGAGFGTGVLFQHLFGGSGAKAGIAGGGSGALEGALIGSIVPGIGTAIGALIAGISGLLGGLINFGPSKKEVAARQDVQTFQQQTFGGLTPQQRQEAVGAGWSDPAAAGTLIAVRDAYVSIGKTSQDAERDVKALWDAEKQGPEATTAAMQPLLAALDAQKKKQTDVTAAVEEQKAKYAELADGIKAQMADLDKSIADLDASEKPEKVMGVIETQQREAFAKQKQALEAALEANNKAAADAVEKAKKDATSVTDGLGNQVAQLPEQFADSGRESWARFSKEFDGREIHIPIIPDLPPGSTMPPFPVPPPIPGHADGGLFGTPHLARIAEGGRAEFIGDSDFMGDVVGRALSKSGGYRGPTDVNVTVEIKGIHVDGADVRRALVSPEAKQAVADAYHEALVIGGAQRGAAKRVVKRLVAEA